VTEEWRPAAGFQKYEVSSFGRVRRIAAYRTTQVGKLLRFDTDKDGYSIATLSDDACRFRKVKVNRLVCATFHGEPPSSEHVAAHNNGIRSDNGSDNLRWATEAENFADRYLHQTDPTGERNPRAKLTEDDVNLIRSHLMFGEKKAVLARLFDVTETTIRGIETNRLWRHLEFQL
jgi:hypothetical protein